MAQNESVSAAVSGKQDEDEILEIANRILVGTYPKGTVLLRQGDVSDKCYFILKGCVRQYAFDGDGRETTYNFFTRPRHDKRCDRGSNGGPAPGDFFRFKYSHEITSFVKMILSPRPRRRIDLNQENRFFLEE